MEEPKKRMIHLISEYDSMVKQMDLLLAKFRSVDNQCESLKMFEVGADSRKYQSKIEKALKELIREA
ncbi:MAG: hypothetical protein AABY53_01080 [Bdellovibrionota bacterium]